MRKCLPLFVVFLFLGIGELIGQDATSLKEAKEFIRIGDSLVTQRNYKEALPHYEKARQFYLSTEDWKKSIKSGVKISEVSHYTKPKNDIEFVKELINLAEEKMPKENFLLGELYELLGGAFEDHRNFMSSIKNHNIALGKFKIVLSENHIHFSRVYNNLGAGHMGLGEFKTASMYFNKALNINLQAEETPDVLNNISDNYTNLGIIEKESGNFEKAISYYDKSILICRKLGNEIKEGIAYYNAGNALGKSGNYLSAVDYLHKSLTLFEANLGVEHPHIIIVSNLIGNFYQILDKDSKALSYLKESHDLSLKVYGSKHPRVAFQKMALGVLYNNIEECDSTNFYLNDAKKIINAIEEPDPLLAFQVSQVLLDFSVTCPNQRDSIENYFKLALKNVRKIYGQKNHLISNLFYTKADFHLKENEPQYALAFIQKALIANSWEFEEPSKEANPTLNDLINKKLGIQEFSLKANILAKLWQNNKTNRAMAEEVLKCHQLSYDLATNFTNQIAKKQVSRDKGVLNINPAAIAINDIYDFYNHFKEPNFLEQYLEWIERTKSNILLQSFQNSNAETIAGIPNEFLNQERDLNLKIQQYEQKIDEAISNKDTVNIRKYRDELLFDTKVEREELITFLEDDYPDYFNLKYEQATVSFAQLKEILDTNLILIEYAITENTADQELHIIVIDKKSPPKVVRIPVATGTKNRIEALNHLLRKSTMSRNTSREKFINQSHELYKQFLQPIEDQLVGKDRIIIIGDGMTNYIPFEVLLKSNKIKEFKDLDFLVKNHEVSYHYSATLFAKAKERSNNTENSGIYAFAPVYEDLADEAVTARKTRSIEIDSTLRAYDADGNFSPLPESEREVKSIMSLFEKSGSTGNQLDLKKDATEASLKSNLEKPFKYIHIAGHSFADLKNPKFSGIACFDQTELTEGKEDGTLYTGEIYNIASKADLVTLSSCESGFGKLEKTEGLLGLNRAFIYAGAPNVVFSLWKVYDKVSAQMMVDFYKNMLDGKTYSASLREAKLNLLKKEETASPHFWSPFLLIGK